jgi:hypothetical protein
MEFSLANIDVDGSLANPVIRVAVAIWAVILAVPLIVMLRRVTTARDRLICVAAVFAFGCVTSPLANRALGVLIYQVITKPGVSVGFFGGPPFFASPLAAVAIAGVAAYAIRRVGRRVRTV